MKIRTDFVTNSSSSSFVTVIAEFKNGLRKKCELEYESGIPVEVLDGRNIHSGKDLLDALDKLYEPGSPRNLGFWPDREDVPEWVDKDCYAGIVSIEEIDDLSVLSRLELRSRSEYDSEGSFSSKKLLIGAPREKMTRADWEKVYRYGKSNIEKKYPKLAAHGFSAIAIMGYLGKDSEVDVPGFILRGNVVEIGARSFAGLEHITSVTIPESVIVISKEAFANCPNLETVRLPASLREIGSRAFAGCPKLEKPSIPDTVLLGKDVFASESSAVKKSFGEALDSGDLAEWEKVFKLEAKKTKVNLLEKKDIKAAKLVIPGRIDGKKVDVSAINDRFCDDRYLEDLTIGKGFTEWIKGFNNCKKLRSITVEEEFSGVLIGFDNCPNLTELTLAEDFSGEIHGFENCPKLIGLQIPSKAKVASSSFAGSAWWNSFDGPIVINEKLIGFHGDQKELVIPETVETIPGDFSRWTMGLERIVIPPTVREIEKGAFWKYQSPEAPPLEIVIPAGHLNFGDLNENFRGCRSITLRAPAGCKIQKYAEKHWISFRTI